MEENNNKPTGLIQINRTYADRSAPGRGHFTGKLSAYEKSLEVAKNLHMGYTGRKFGPGRPTPAR